MIIGFSELREPDGEVREYDLFIAVDCAALDRLGKAQPAFEKARKTLCIDHHVSNKGYALTNIIDGDASSACEVICRLLDMEKISIDAASALYMGIAHDTGVFQYSCTGTRTMEIAGQLMAKGIDFTSIIKDSFYTKSYAQNHIMGRTIMESIMLLNQRCIVGYVRQKDMDFYGVEGKDLDGVVSQLRLTAGVEVAIFIYEMETQLFKVSLRSNGKVDVSRIAVFFGGGGHVRAAGVTMKGTFHDIINNLTLHIERQMLDQEE